MRFPPQNMFPALLLSASLGVTLPAMAVEVTVTVENLAPGNGTFLTPVWVGFHDGGFDLYDRDVAVGTGALPAGLEALAEDGNTMPVSGEFATIVPTGTDTTILSAGDPPPFAPGESGSVVLDVDPANAFFSYASMVIPSNDAFIANGNPQAHQVFDAAGNVIPTEIIVVGAEVLDAGTEVNDELPANTAFFGQATPDTGVDENGVVILHPGFNAPGSGGILDDAMFAAADFTANGYQVARITISGPAATPVAIPTLSGAAMLGLGLLLAGIGTWVFRRRGGLQR